MSWRDVFDSARAPGTPDPAPRGVAFWLWRDRRSSEEIRTSRFLASPTEPTEPGDWARIESIGSVMATQEFCEMLGMEAEPVVRAQLLGKLEQALAGDGTPPTIVTLDLARRSRLALDRVADAVARRERDEQLRREAANARAERAEIEATLAAERNRATRERAELQAEVDQARREQLAALRLRRENNVNLNDALRSIQTRAEQAARASGAMHDVSGIMEVAIETAVRATLASVEGRSATEVVENPVPTVRPAAFSSVIIDDDDDPFEEVEVLPSHPVGRALIELGRAFGITFQLPPPGTTLPRRTSGRLREVERVSSRPPTMLRVPPAVEVVWDTYEAEIARALRAIADEERERARAARIEAERQRVAVGMVTRRERRITRLVGNVAREGDDE